MFTVDIAFFEHRSIPSPLTFYSKEKILRGTVLYAPLRTGKILGIVTACEPLSSKKGDIRGQTFQLKKIDGRSALAIVDESVLATCEKIARLQGIPLPLALECVVPMYIQENTELLQPFFDRILSWISTSESLPVHYFEHDLVYRIDHYKSIVRDALTKKESVVIVSPTIANAEYIQNTVGKGVTHKVILLTSDLSKKEMRLAYEQIYDEDNVGLVVCTTAHYALSLPKKLHTYIIDQEGNPSYYSFDTPAYDYKAGLHTFASQAASHTIVADTILRFSSYKAILEDKGIREFSIHGRFARTRNIAISTPKEGSSFSYIHEDVAAIIKKLKKNERMYVYVPRKGIHSSLVCLDCGELHTCITCGKPYAIYEDALHTRSIRCTYCRTKKDIPHDTEILCERCSSWRIQGYGVTGGALKSAITELTHSDVYLAEKESGTSIEKMCVAWEETGGILIGTDACIPHITKQVQYSVVSSVDGWFTVPDIDSTRRLVQLLEPLLEYTKNTVYIQTRNPKNETFSFINEPSFDRYVKTELEERRESGHPPYTVFVLIRKSSGMNVEEAKRLQIHFNDYDASMYKVHTDIRVLLRVAQNIFATSETLQKELQDLNPYMIVEVNPLSLFTLPRGGAK